MFKFDDRAWNNAIYETEGDLAKAATDAMGEGTDGLKGDMREQTIRRGMGQRMANTWRGKVYPERRRSLDPAGYIWSNAPKIADAFERNPEIAAINGGRYLVIPTDNVPRSGRYLRRLTPAQIERSFGQKLTFMRGKRGHILAFVKVAAADNRRGYTTARTKLNGRNADVKLILMFTLVRTVRPGKRFDLQGAAEFWADQLPGLFDYHLGRT